MNNQMQTNQTENKSEDNPYITPCEELGYSVGDVFEVLHNYSKYCCKGMIVKLHEDDESNNPWFTYYSGPCANSTHDVDRIAIKLDHVRKIHQKAELAKPAEEIQGIALYSTEDIDAAWVKLHWAEDSKALLIKKLNEVTDPEYKEYLRLKAKYETK